MKTLLSRTRIRIAVAAFALVLAGAGPLCRTPPPAHAAQAPDDFDDLDNPAVAAVIVGVNPDRLRISTDRTSYTLNQGMRICYAVPTPGWIAVYDYLPDGRVLELLSGYDDGRGDCLDARITPPTGRECLRIRFFFEGGTSMSRATCFDVRGGATPPTAANPPARTNPPAAPNPPASLAGRYLRVSVSGTSATVNWVNPPVGPGEWVSIVPVGTRDDTHVNRWTYILDSQRASGSYTTTGLASGEYEARLYRDYSYNTIIDRVRFRVP